MQDQAPAPPDTAQEPNQVNAQESNTFITSPSVPLPTQQPIVPLNAQRELKPPTTLGVIVAAGMGLMLVTFLLGYISTNPDIVLCAGDGVGLIGVVCAVLLGIYTGKRMLFGLRRNEQTGNGVHPIFIIGAVLIPLAGIAAEIIPISAILLLVAIALFIIGIHLSRPGTPGVIRHYKNVSKVMLVIVAVLGGILPTLIVAAFGYLMLWSRWCDLTNSKCL